MKLEPNIWIAAVPFYGLRAEWCKGFGVAGFAGLGLWGLQFRARVG